MALTISSDDIYVPCVKVPSIDFINLHKCVVCGHNVDGNGHSVTDCLFEIFSKVENNL